MATADSQWPQFYQGLQHFRQLAVKPATAPDIATAVQHSNQLSSLFITLANQNFNAVIAQLNLTPRFLPVDLARTVKMLALGLILGRGYGWQSQRSQQFLQAVILLETLTPDAQNRQNARVSTTKALQQFNKQHPLLPLLIAACNAQRLPTWQLHPDGPLFTLVSQLAAQLLPATGNQSGLEQLLVKYQSSQADIVNAKWFCLLQQLAEVQALPGRFARARQTHDSTSHYWFICGIAPTQSQPFAIYARQFDPVSKTVGSEVQLLQLAELTLLSPQYFRDASWLTLLEQDEDVLPVPADATLDNCLSGSVFYQVSQLSITKQVQLLETQPVMSHFLQRAAAGISRQHLPVNRLRHAVTMLGQDALSDWVAQAELHQFCLRQVHPHQQWLEQLQQCLAHALLLISRATNQPLAAGNAGVIARCASVSLWQHPALPQTALARHVQHQLLLSVHIQQHIWQAKSYPELVQQLLLHYQQPDWSRAMQGWFDRGSGPLTLLLRLSWQLTLAVFCGGSVNEQRLTAILQAASTQLKLPEHPVTYWQTQLITACHCYYPLPEM